MIYDIVIIGGGPAGLTAAVYGRRANKSVLVIEKETFGGQITFSPKVENIPGFTALSGNEFAEKLVDQALSQGVEFESAVAEKIEDGEIKTVVTDSGEFKAKAVIIATGARHRLLGAENEEKFIGDGISFCAVCDGAFYKDLTVGVVGGGNSALQEALLLADLAKEVYVIQNLDFLTGEAKLSEQIYAKENVKVILGTVVEKINGEDAFAGVTLKKEATGETYDLPLDGLFIAIGLVPQNEGFADVIALDSRGYADAAETCTTQTKGIFVAGDCRAKKIRQVTTAAADGAIAALAACDYIEGR
ncbi:MAG: FAD-dependent oxidoreductase [Clostridiales bacterium]|nr:FAD-dependent oxidoreductase [Candidatus Equinaster intestinalis]